MIKGYISINKFNGSALVIRNGKKFYEKSYGYQNAETKKLITKHSIFPIDSLTKSFTALLVLKLAEENKLSVEDPISTYIPDYPKGNQIKIKYLLSNTGGIFGKFRNAKFYEMAFFKNELLDFEPGTKFSYSNSGFDLLGIIVEKVTGSSYSVKIKQGLSTKVADKKG